MKLRKVLSSVIAGALAASAMAVTANAAILDSPVGTLDGTNWSYDLVAEEVDWANAKGCFIVIKTTEPVEDAFGGGIMMNGTACGWFQDNARFEWACNSEEKPIIGLPDDDGCMYLFAFDLDDGIFGTEDDVTEDFYAQIFLQQWWGDADFTVEYVEFTNESAEETLDSIVEFFQLLDGEVGSAPVTLPDSTPVEGAAPAAGSVDAATAGGSKDSPDTGAADVAVAAGLAVVAVGAALVSKKRK